MVNDRFFAYYKAQGIVPHEEWDQFVERLRQHLPTTFRLAGSRQCVHPELSRLYLIFIHARTAKGLNKLVQDVHVPALSDVTFEDQKIPPPVQIPWYSPDLPKSGIINSGFYRYPDGLAWQFNVPKRVLRKSPEFKKFHSFLVFETEVVSQQFKFAAGIC